MMNSLLGTSTSRFVKYRDTRMLWRWRLVANNGRIIADSAESYHNEGDCDRGIALVKDSHRSPVSRA
jgi:uncharacterized protein YegP (UPF0339 family)